MPALHVDNVPEPLIEALQRRASAHDRTLQGELLIILQDAVTTSVAEVQPARLRLVLAKESNTSDLGREDLYEENGR